jgi:Family of unknown function (DUF6082)
MPKSRQYSFGKQVEMSKSKKRFLSFTGLAWLLGIAVTVICIALLISYGLPKNLNDLAALATAVTGVLTVAALLLTLYTVNLQREDIEFQRQEMIKASRAQLRTLHSELLVQALGDSELLAVWIPENNNDVKWFKQSVYINQILSHWQTLLEIGEITPEGLELMLSTYMSRPAFKRFWSEVRDLRARSAETSSHSTRLFHEIAEEAYHRVVAAQKTSN